ncbi:hypothetical protein GPK89_05145 [Gemmiger formicilis]|uniref:hypothetical protein n=1 Tax=Gemmiger formicilis TaxID=745368 RepID=UPI001C025FB9|nr:hypothetical protein [Gemmiger formicilis]MBT9674121.1 hypothetical protein [Gemmiger formicilis]
MRKRLFIFAAATCFALSAFATPAFAGEPSLPDEPTIGSEASVQSDGNSNGNPDGNSDGNSDGNVKEDALPGGSNDALPNGENNNSERQTNPSVAAPVVAKIGETEYPTLQAAITDACNGTTSSDATITITLQSDLELTEGLRFIGSGDNADQWKKITLDAAKHSLTLKQKGIYATRCEVTIKNCRELTVNAGTNPGNANKENANISAVFFGPGTLILDECAIVNITNLEPNDSGGSGLCIYNGGNLCIQNNTHFTVSGFMNRIPVNPGEEGKGGCSGIYIDSDPDQNDEYKTIKGRIDVSNNSTLTATNCYHNGITANPVDVKVTNYSEINVNRNGDARDPYAHKGGIGCYYGTMTISDHSRVISENNGSTFGIFVHNLDVDGTSEIESRYDTIYGIAFNGNAVLQSGAKMTSVGHWGPGIALYDFNGSKGSLTVQKDAVLSSSSTAVGLANGGNNFNVLAGAQVYLNDNVVGLDNYPNATTTVEADAHLEICRNGAWGIKNGNSDIGSGTLVLNAGLITENNKLDSIPYKGNITFNVNDRDYEHKKYGGGIYNEYGTVSLSPLVKVYNNKAVTAGDDLYNTNKGGNSFNIIKLEPGAKWSVLDDDGKIIDDWYHDTEGEENRWKPATAKNNTVTILPLGAALKAAHGINAPTPSPKPAEPTAAPTEAPTPTAAPTTIPTVAPTAAPTTAPTAAPADNTATAAPATPAPTAQPTVTATPAPTAQASGVIPQTGDSSSPALFSILTLGSITALCVLQKRRKSK